MFFLSSHYRNPLTFTDDSVQSQGRALDRLKHSLKVRSGEGGEMEHILYRDRFIEAMDEDLNTPRALAVLFDLARDINRESSSGLDVIKAQTTLAELSRVLGLTLSNQNSYSGGDIAPFVEMLITVRSELREVKQFDLADNIREKLSQLGISLEDTEEGTIWRFS